MGWLRSDRVGAAVVCVGALAGFFHGLSLCVLRHGDDRTSRITPRNQHKEPLVTQPNGNRKNQCGAGDSIPNHDNHTDETPALHGQTKQDNAQIMQDCREPSTCTQSSGTWPPGTCTHLSSNSVTMQERKQYTCRPSCAVNSQGCLRDRQKYVQCKTNAKQTYRAVEGDGDVGEACWAGGEEGNVRRGEGGGGGRRHSCVRVSYVHWVLAIQVFLAPDCTC